MNIFRSIKDYFFYKKKFNDIFSFDDFLIDYKEFSDLKEKYTIYKKELYLSHTDYITNISVGSSAASLELSALICSIYEIKSPQNVIDYGSGYTSYILRKIQSTNKSVNKNVFSVDSSDDWLNKTQDYLRQNKLVEKNLLTWEEYSKNYSLNFDLVIVDIRPITRRVELIKNYLLYNKKNTILIIDDFHKDHLKKPILMLKKKFNFKIYSLKDITLDNYGRYAAIIII